MQRGHGVPGRIEGRHRSTGVLTDQGRMTIHKIAMRNRIIFCQSMIFEDGRARLFRAKKAMNWFVPQHIQAIGTPYTCARLCDACACWHDMSSFLLSLPRQRWYHRVSGILPQSALTKLELLQALMEGVREPRGVIGWPIILNVSPLRPGVGHIRNVVFVTKR